VYLGKVIKYLILLIPALCVAQDSWLGKDKAQHFLGSAVLSYGLSEVMSADKAFLTAVGIGLAKEVYDYQHPEKHTASYKDFIADVAGAYVGIYAKGYSFNYQNKTFVVRYTMQIK
jgi:putative lipoprotein